MKENKKLILIIIITIVGIILVSGGTYAIYTWAMSEKLTATSECFDIVYVKGQDIGSENNSRLFMPSDDYTGGLFASVIVNVVPSCTINGNGSLYLNTDTSTSKILLDSGVLKYQVIENSLTKLESGTISSTGETLLSSNIEVTTNPKQLTVAVWIDGSLITDENIDEILSSSYIGNISMKVESGE